MSGTLGMLANKDDHPVIGVFDHQNGDSNPAFMAVLGAPGLQKKTVSLLSHNIFDNFPKNFWNFTLI